MAQADAEDEDLQHQEQVENELLDGILKKFGVEFTGAGPKEDPKSEENKEEQEANDLQGDALNGLGFGFEAYWKMLRTLSISFLLMTLAFLPQLVICYATGGMLGYGNYADDVFTLGNLGFSGQFCYS